MRDLPRLQALRVLVGRGPQAETLRPRVGAIHLDAVARLLAFYRSDPALREAPSLRPVLRALRRMRLRVGLVSELPRAATDALLARLGWLDAGLLDATIAGDEVRDPAPRPDAVLALMRHFEVTEARRVARVSDAAAGLAQGMSAGCGAVIAVVPDAEAARALAGARFTHRAASLLEVAACLGVSVDGADEAGGDAR